jgi:hypothetical protein
MTGPKLIEHTGGHTGEGEKQAIVLVSIRISSINLTPQKSVMNQQQRMKMHLNCQVMQNALQF